MRSSEAGNESWYMTESSKYCKKVTCIDASFLELDSMSGFIVKAIFSVSWRSCLTYKYVPASGS